MYVVYVLYMGSMICTVCTVHELNDVCSVCILDMSSMICTVCTVSVQDACINLFLLSTRNHLECLQHFSAVLHLNKCVCWTMTSTSV